MRNVTSVDPPNLFTPGLIPENEPVGEGSSSGQQARAFVMWCWGVGDDFHNSPDITNLRFWLEKYGRKKQQLSTAEEDEVLGEARRLYLKKVEQAVRKVDVPKVAD